MKEQIKPELKDLDRQLQDREEIVYIQGIEHSVIIFNDAKEVAELYAEKFIKESDQLKLELQQIKLILSNTVDFIENNICTNWAGIEEAKKILNENRK